MSIGECDGVRYIADVSKERAEITLKMAALFTFETLATEPSSKGCQHSKTCICEIVCGLFQFFVKVPRGGVGGKVIGDR